MTNIRQLENKTRLMLLRMLKTLQKQLISLTRIKGFIKNPDDLRRALAQISLIQKQVCKILKIIKDIPKAKCVICGEFNDAKCWSCIEDEMDEVNFREYQKDVKKSV